VDSGLPKSGRKIKSSARKAGVSSDVESRKGDGHRVDAGLVGSTKLFYAFFFIYGKFLL
jgi:hypothetical protein